MFAGLMAIFTLFSGIKDLSLKDVAKPYIGEYNCIEAEFGGVDYLEDFEYITIDLKKDNTFVLRYAQKNGKKGEEKGEYQFDNVTKKLVLSGKSKLTYNLETLMNNGTFAITVRFGGKTLHIKFEQQ